MAVLKKDVVIAGGASLSAAVDIDGSSLVGIVMPAAWTAANLTFQGSSDDSVFNNLYDDAGTEVTVTAAAARYIAVQPSEFVGFDTLKIRSGTSGTAVTQAAARTITLILLPMS